MSTGVMSVRLPRELKERLDALSASTGRPAAFYLREALGKHLTELEYGYALRAEAEAARRGETETFSLDEVMADFGMTRDDLAAANPGGTTVSDA